MRAARAYKSVHDTTSVMSNDSVGLVVLLYERLLQRILEADAALHRHDIEGRGRATSAAIQIINEGLIGALDMEQGGEVAKSLKGHYHQWIALLLKCNLRGDADPLVTLRMSVTELLSAWLELKKNHRPGAKTAPS